MNPSSRAKVWTWTPTILLSVVVTVASGGMWVINEKVSSVSRLYEKDISAIREIVDTKFQSLEKQLNVIESLLKEAILRR